MSTSKPIQLGLCCLNTTLRSFKPPIFASRKMIMRSIEEKGIDVLKDKIIQNLKDVLTMMDWNEQNGIKVFRLSSELFPHKSNPKVCNYTFEFAHTLLKQIGEKAHTYQQRITFHPGQYNVVGTPNPATFLQTCADLTYHAEVLELCGLDGLSPVIVVHGGGIYKDKSATILRWCEQYYQLPELVRKYLVLENCEKCFSIKDCLEISKRINIPVVFDTHHYNCYCDLHPNETFYPPEYYIPDILLSWKKRNLKPKFHVSEQGKGRVGHHSDFIKEIPTYLLDIPKRYKVDIDIMIEAKMKEQAIHRLYQRYPEMNGLNDFIPGNGWTHMKRCFKDECCAKKRYVLVMKCCKLKLVKGTNCSC